jgi:hypothetical protein
LEEKIIVSRKYGRRGRRGRRLEEDWKMMNSLQFTSYGVSQPTSQSRAIEIHRDTRGPLKKNEIVQEPHDCFSTDKDDLDSAKSCSNARTKNRSERIQEMEKEYVERFKACNFWFSLNKRTYNGRDLRTIPIGSLFEYATRGMKVDTFNALVTGRNRVKPASLLRKVVVKRDDGYEEDDYAEFILLRLVQVHEIEERTDDDHEIEDEGWPLCTFEIIPTNNRSKPKEVTLNVLVECAFQRLIVSKLASSAKRKKEQLIYQEYSFPPRAIPSGAPPTSAIVVYGKKGEADIEQTTTTTVTPTPMIDNSNNSNVVFGKSSSKKKVVNFFFKPDGIIPKKKRSSIIVLEQNDQQNLQQQQLQMQQRMQHLKQIEAQTLYQIQQLQQQQKNIQMMQMQMQMIFSPTPSQQSFMYNPLQSFQNVLQPQHQQQQQLQLQQSQQISNVENLNQLADVAALFNHPELEPQASVFATTHQVPPMIHTNNAANNTCAECAERRREHFVYLSSQQTKKTNEENNNINDDDDEKQSPQHHHHVNNNNNNSSSRKKRTKADAEDKFFSAEKQYKT